MKSAEIRERFLSYFAERGHAVVSSSSLIPDNDPTLYFANAGMVQFKNLFTGQEVRDYSRAATSQKCLRVSGKHNDLEEVGRTPRHHTLFEMLGNFSFGDYFKRDAIKMSWELLTEGFGLDVDRLWVTVFEEDDEAERIWIDEVGVAPDRVQRLGAKENFWSMGDTGPCGPCSEIHWDRGPAFGRDGGPAVDDDRFMEIWNLVFMQFEQREDGSRIDLPNPSIDTGMGLERLATVLQGVTSNYDTDVFQPLIQKAAALAGVSYGQDDETDLALRVIADHARAAAFLIADGVIPDKGGRGYVLRRIMRRAIRFGYKLGMSEPFLFAVADGVIAQMVGAYPYLEERRSLVNRLIQIEERLFFGTIDRGMVMLDEALGALPEGGTLDGASAFTLYDTHGFPLDLTRLIAGERGFDVDGAGFDAEMEKQRERGRKNWKGSGDAGTSAAHAALAADVGETIFTGYTDDTAEGPIAGIVCGGEVVASLAAGDRAELVFTSTPFYAESGGQVGDSGEIRVGEARFRVDDVQKGPGGVFLHRGELISGQLFTGEQVELSVDASRRDRTRLNHTATHLLHAALREVLGDHVGQKGSLVDPERLRFDFSHFEPVTPAELAEIEQRVLAQLDGNRGVGTEEMDIEDAKRSGAVAMFGEKYGERVRVVSVGDFSVEFCGGTHARRTGDIGIFKITSESGVAAGVRRIEALTGPGARDFLWSRDASAVQAAAQLRAPVAELPQAIERLQQDRKRLEKEIEALKQELAQLAAGDLTDQIREVNGLKVLAAKVPGDARTLRSEADRLRDEIGSGLVVLGSDDGGKVLLIAAATNDVAGGRVHAGNIIRAIAGMVGGRGGGRPNMAQAGGSDPSGLDAALEKVYELV